MKMVVGLGNPGKPYLNNRHNAGFMLIDAFVNKHNLSIKKENNYELAIFDKLLLLKPMTYMNLSGEAVIQAIDKHDIDDLMVIVDDVNLPFGNIRIREKGGDGGHNGLKSIAEVLDSQDFKRLRIGVGNEKDRVLSDFVLSDFTKQEVDFMKNILSFGLELLEVFCRADFKFVLNYYSKNNKTYSEKLKNFQDLLTKGEKDVSKI